MVEAYENWLESAKLSLDNNDSYSATREFIGALNRAIMRSSSEDIRYVAKKIAHILQDHQKLSFLYPILHESFKSLKRKKDSTPMVEVILRDVYAEIDSMVIDCNLLIEFMMFAKDYSPEFVIEESELFLIKCDGYSDQIIQLILPLSIATKNYAALKHILTVEKYTKDPIYRCYHILIEILIGASAERIKRLLSGLYEFQTNPDVSITQEIVQSVIDNEVAVDLNTIVTGNNINDPNLRLLVIQVKNLLE